MAANDPESRSDPLAKGPGTDERRTTERWAPNWLQCTGGDVLDVSRDGLRLLTRRKMDGVLDLKVWDNRRSIAVVAEVAWTKRLGFRRWEVGLRFMTDDATRDAIEHLDKSSAFGVEGWALPRSA